MGERRVNLMSPVAVPHATFAHLCADVIKVECIFFVTGNVFNVRGKNKQVQRGMQNAFGKGDELMPNIKAKEEEMIK